MMRSRLTSLLLVAPLVATGIAFLDAPPAEAEDTGEPLNDDLRTKLQRIPSEDGERVEGLGDEAYASKFDDVTAIAGNVAVQAKLQNYAGSPAKFRSVSEGALRTALPRLAQLPTPTS